MKIFSAFFSGLIFALGLVLAEMTIPARVIGFLDLSGTWNPSLIFVMIGAILVYSIAHRLILRRSKPVFDDEFHIPLSGRITIQLIAGSMIFGIGWALAGFCPGPAITSAGAGSSEALIFVLFMVVGMAIYRLGFARKIF